MPLGALGFFKNILKEAEEKKPLFISEERAQDMESVLLEASLIIEEIPESFRGQDIAVAVDNTRELVASLIAVWTFGARPLMPNGFLEESLERVSSLTSCMICDSGIVSDTTKSFFKDLIELKPVQTKNNSFSKISKWLLELSDEKANSLELVQMTSGSTGTPKKVSRTLKSFFSEVKAMIPLFGIKDFSNTLSVATVPNFHAYGIVFRFFLPLFLGIPVYNEMLRYEEQFEKLKKYNATLFVTANPGFLKRLSKNRLGLETRLLLSAGGKLPLDARKDTYQFFNTAIFEILGSTETGVMAWHLIEKGDDKEELLWRCVPGNNVFITQDDSKEGKDPLKLENTGYGRLLFASPWLEHPNYEGILVNGTIIPVFASGDMVTLSGEGISLQGREGRILKIEDNRVSLDALEEAMRKLPEIKDVVVLPYHNTRREGTEAAIVLSEEGQKIYKSMSQGRFVLYLRSIMLKKLIPVSVPRHYLFFTDKLPETPTGKPDYKKIAKLMA